jgi:aspartyl-tRNA(Asn)/glutamyl-tRNA(Gln) amidotransferase subunit A
VTTVRGSLVDVAARVRQQQVTAVELTEKALSAIEGADSTWRAFSYVAAAEAMADARQLDIELGRGQLRGALHGVPIAVKDNIAVAGWPLTAGSEVLVGNVSSHDAAVVASLRRAGAVIVGKTVMHEFGRGTDVVPTVYPWRPGFYTGGSSAGSAVALATGLVAGALGTDVGGSIRIPASLNGVVGLKPTFGVVEREGVLPLTWSLGHVGPMARTVEDVGVLFEVLSAPAVSAGSLEPQRVRSGDLRGVRIGFDPSATESPAVQSDVAAVVLGAVRRLADLGASIVEIDGPDLKESAAVAEVIIAAESFALHERWLGERASRYREATRRSLEAGRGIRASDYLGALRARWVAARDVETLFDENDLTTIVQPTLPMNPLPATDMNCRSSGSGGETPLSRCARYTRWASVTGQPALSLPCGLSREGLPVGLQVVGRPYSEWDVVGVGVAYERAYPWTGWSVAERGK